MIVYDLSCASGHRFEGWFGSSDDFAVQRDRGLLTCPQCGSSQVEKAPMAPAVPRKGNQQAVQPAISESVPSGPVETTRKPVLANTPLPPEVATALEKLAQAQARALENSTWVGGNFAETSRAMHYGERDAEPIHGQATAEEARALVDEGIAIAPLPFPVAPPDKLN